ncbi:MAG: hypothetical protein A2623_11670 [Caulobacterales bacterium RIFCSPHIGHO2_01_FULL_70_19]|nr:MAG: hypothetical protein A2623_11670 [Caulobacterales bacterium RIFCSPHIGHO2_01_FULL_70_19]
MSPAVEREYIVSHMACEQIRDAFVHIYVASGPDITVRQPRHEIAEAVKFGVASSETELSKRC